MIRLGCIAAVTILLSGCAVMSKNECLNANWASIGQRDGMNGSGSLLKAREQACSKHQIEIDHSLYSESYKKGLRTYCNPQSVFTYALNGRGNYQSCPLEMHNELMPYYSTAKEYYDTKSNLEKIEKRIADARGSLSKSDLKADTRDYYRGVISENSELLPQARRNFNEAERSLSNFKRAMGLP